MQGVFFIRFPVVGKRHPNRNVDKIQRWVHACSREDFTMANVTRHTYICSRHFVGGQGPTDDHPDPIPANNCNEQVAKFSRKRRATASRSGPTVKCDKSVNNNNNNNVLEAAETLLALNHSCQQQAVVSPCVAFDVSDSRPRDSATVHRDLRKTESEPEHKSGASVLAEILHLRQELTAANKLLAEKDFELETLRKKRRQFVTSSSGPSVDVDALSAPCKLMPDTLSTT
jgi:hypothetical protein